MFNKLLIKIVKKVGYVKNLEINVEQLKAVETRLREEKGYAVREKNRLALKVKYMESVVIDEAALKENENKHVMCVHSFPVNRIVLRVKEGNAE